MCFLAKLSKILFIIFEELWSANRRMGVGHFAGDLKADVARSPDNE